MNTLDIINHWKNSGIRGTFNEGLYRRIQEIKQHNENDHNIKQEKSK